MVQFLSINFFLGFLQFLLVFSKVPVLLCHSVLKKNKHLGYTARYGGCVGGMVLTGENRSARRTTCAIAIMTSDPTRTGLGLKH